MARAMKDSGIEWIGEIPEGWETNTAFQIFTQVKNKNEGLQEQNLLSLSYGKIKRKNIETVGGLLPENFDGYNIIEADDIVLRLTDLQNDQKSLRVGLSPERGIVTSAYLTLRNRSTSLPKYLYYYLHAFEISKGFYGMGAGVRQGLNWDGLKWLKILTPPVSEQEKIVSFLDAECAQIDVVIEQTRASIDEYKKLKQSVVTHAVTKGIRPDRKMKDSGIDWIGEMPEEWEVHKLCWDYNAELGKMLDAKRVTGEHLHPYIKNVDVQWWTINSSNLDEMDFTDDEFERYTIKHGDLMICEGGEIGKCAVVPDGFPDGIFYQKALHRVRPRNCKLSNTDFLSYVIFCMAKQDAFETTHEKATIQHLPGDALSQLRIPTPPFFEQCQIVSYIINYTQKNDALIHAKEQLISELESYKNSLIFEYVTGKKEVLK